MALSFSRQDPIGGDAACTRPCRETRGLADTGITLMSNAPWRHHGVTASPSQDAQRLSLTPSRCRNRRLKRQQLRRCPGACCHSRAKVHLAAGTGVSSPACCWLCRRGVPNLRGLTPARLPPSKGDKKFACLHGVGDPCNAVGTLRPATNAYARPVQGQYLAFELQQVAQCRAASCASSPRHVRFALTDRTTTQIAGRRA